MLNMACERGWFSCYCVNLLIIALGFSIVIAERETSSSTIAQEHIPSQDELLQNLPDLGNIPGRFASFNISSTKTEDVEKPFREMCEKNGGPAAYSTAEDSLTIFPQCIQSLINVTELKSEIEDAKPRGQLNIVFEKYCPRVPNIKMCITNMTDSIESCLASDERDNIKIISNIIDSFLEFICHDDGDRIAMFIAAGGTECFQSQQQAVMECANQTFSCYIPTEIPSGSAAFGITSITKFVWSRELCNIDIEIFRTCTVDALEECRDPTAAYVVDSLFNYVKRATPCNNLLTPEVSAVTETLSSTIAEEHFPSQDELLQNVPDLGNIPSRFASFNIFSIKTEDVEKAFRDVCEKNGGPAAYSSAKDSLTNFSECIQSLVNVTEFKSEIEAAKPRGELDIVFEKYCRKVPNLEKCITNMTDSIESCLAPDERDNIKIISNITHSFLEFICQYNGDRIAMFIAADGIECFKSKQQAVMECAKQTHSSYISAEKQAGGAAFGMTNIPTLAFSLEQCTGIEKFRTCTVEVLGECYDPTPANVVDSLINHMKRATPCDNLLTAKASAVTGTKPIVDTGDADLASDYIDINEFDDVTSPPLSENNVIETFDATHEYYNSSLYVDEIAAKKIWINMGEHPNVTVKHVLSNNYRRALTVELSFDFPFYGHPVRNLTIATDGFLNTGDYVDTWLGATQYIAPLMAIFDTRLSDNSYVKYADNGTAFTVEWENVVLQEQPKAGGFTFQVTLHKNGDIVFIYAAVPLVIDQIRSNSYPVKVGLSDAYITERTVYSTRQKALYEYHRVRFINPDIRNWTVIYLSALTTCVKLDNCNDCLSRSTGFECKWCPSLNRCSTGTDRHRHDWMVSKCELNNIKEGESCPVINNKTTTYDQYEHDIQAVHEPEGSVRGVGVLSDNVIQPSHEANAPGTIEHSQETEIGREEIVSLKNQSAEIRSQPFGVSNFSVECLDSKTKNANDEGRDEKSKEELSNLSKFFLNIAETVETFPKIYQIEIKSQVFELVTKYERQMILASEKSDKEVPLNAPRPAF